MAHMLGGRYLYFIVFKFFVDLEEHETVAYRFQ